MPCDLTGAPVHPSGVVPFGIGETEARDAFAAWLDDGRTLGHRFARFPIETWRAVYLPCWTFTAHARVPWRGEIRKKNREGTYDPHPVDGVVEQTFENVFVPAAGSAPQDLLQEAEGFWAKDLRPYDVRYLAGFEVELYAVNLWDAWDAADRRMQDRIDAALRRTGASGLETWPEWSGQRCRHVLVPVYAIEYAHRGRRFAAVVNGRTGEVAGRRPIDPIGIAIGLTVLLAILAGLGTALVWLADALF